MSPADVSIAAHPSRDEMPLADIAWSLLSTSKDGSLPTEI